LVPSQLVTELFGSCIDHDLHFFPPDNGTWTQLWLVTEYHENGFDYLYA
jgi:hypothetical protein